MKFFVSFSHHSTLQSGSFLLSMVVLFVGVYALFTQAAFADDATANNTQRLVTIHDSSVAGGEKTLVTRALTVRQALDQAGVVVSPRDIVEPSLDMTFEAKSYQVNVFRARPIVVVDGTMRTKVMTAEQSPRQIAKAAGITMYDEDTTEIQRVDNVLTSGGAAVQMTISRAQSLTLNLFGKKTTIRSKATTVEGLLKEKKITLGSQDGVSPGPQTPLTASLEVRVWRNGKQTVTLEEIVARPVEQIKDADRSVGVREVKDPGADGKRTVTYEIETKDGVEVGRKEISSVVTLQPVKQIVIVGTKVELPAGSHTDWMAAAGIAPSDYGYVDYIVSHESGWAPTKYNYAGSGAYGLCQALPASKMSTAGGDYMTNPITQLKWCNGYAIGRYGSWAGAYSFWLSHKWW